MPALSSISRSRIATTIAREFVSRGLALLFFILLAAIASAAQAPSSLPKPTGYVSDFANALSPSARAQLEALCTEVDQKTHAQIAVVTVPSFERPRTRRLRPAARHQMGRRAQTIQSRRHDSLVPQRSQIFHAGRLRPRAHPSRRQSRRLRQRSRSPLQRRQQ